MASLNHPDRLGVDAYSDPNLQNQNALGVYSGFTNVLQTPILNAKGIQLLNANIINSATQLGDGQLIFWFYYHSSVATNLRSLANLRCVRLHPANFVPYFGFTAFTKNRYFNNGTELAAALNQAASASGESTTYNPLWIGTGAGLSFSFDTTTRKMSVSVSSGFVGLAAADDPFVLDALRGTTNPNNRIRMNAFNSSGTYATATLQPYVEGQSMNARLGFAMRVNTRPLWSASNSQYGIATSTGAPIGTGQGATSIEGDAYPVLLATQNVNVYVDVITGSGIDSSGRKNLLASIPLAVAPLCVNNYTPNGLDAPALSVPNEVYSLRVELRDDYGQPFVIPPNFNVELEFAVLY